MAESYRRWRLPQLWQMVAADSPANTYLHLTTLRRQQAALETQRDRLRTLRDQLAEAWPPEKSEAATAFIQRVNDMIRAMSETANGAAEVRSRVTLIAEALDQARAELAPLVEQYQRTADQADQRVGEQARKRLDEHARRILMAADAAVVEPAAGLNVVLPTYKRISLPTAVASPPVTTNGSSSGGASGGSASRSVTGFASPRFDPPAVTIDPAEDQEVLLAAGTADDVGHGVIPPLAATADGARTLASAVSAPSLGPGRILGAVPRPGPGVPNGPGTQMNGVISSASGGVPFGGRASGITGSAVRPLGSAGGRQDTSSAQYASRRRASQDGQDELWTVPSGVSAVIEPPATRPHDPGPGVLGIDR
ncbi:hypothetical protein AB0K00_23095 [Dactylosporangium sp. NPDC049525]|uniref:hypothetical protein n=1 Tax=Dactylosporangium sp. NPDC049525 TaxID=3154730 RepID=UPI00343AD0C9